VFIHIKCVRGACANLGSGRTPALQMSHSIPYPRRFYLEPPPPKKNKEKFRGGANFERAHFHWGRARAPGRRSRGLRFRGLRWGGGRGGPPRSRCRTPCRTPAGSEPRGPRSWGTRIATRTAPALRSAFGVQAFTSSVSSLSESDLLDRARISLIFISRWHLSHLSHISADL